VTKKKRETRDELHARLELLEGDTEYTIERVSRSLRKTYRADALTEYMNGPNRVYLGTIPNSVIWGGQSNAVFDYLYVDFMQSVVSTVDELISAGLSVTIYSGNLDLICCTMGTVQWMNRLQWSGIQQLLNSERVPITVNAIVTGFKQSYQNVTFYTILDAGHMVPSDQGDTALLMLREVTGLAR